MNTLSSTIANSQAINQAHRRFIDAANKAVEHAIEAGRLLAEVKADLDHGQWIPWIESNCDFSVRTAQQYVRLHEHRDAIAGNAQRAAHLSLRQAVKEITDQREADPFAKEKAESARFIPPPGGWMCLLPTSDTSPIAMSFLWPADATGDWIDCFLTIRDGAEDGTTTINKREIHRDLISVFLASVSPLKEIESHPRLEPIDPHWPKRLAEIRQELRQRDRDRHSRHAMA